MRARLNALWRRYNAWISYLVGPFPRTSLFDFQFLHRHHFNRHLADSSRVADGLLLDIGCGEKPFRDFFAPRRYLGIDLPHFSGGVAGVTPAVDVFGSGTALHPGQRICTTTPVATTVGVNVDTDCEKRGPANETSIAVNPTDANNIIGGTNEYQLGLNPGGHVTETLLSRAHVTFDGGKSWS